MAAENTGIVLSEHFLSVFVTFAPFSQVAFVVFFLSSDSCTGFSPFGLVCGFDYRCACLRSAFIESENASC